jgi:hypothetical protein
MTWLWSKFQLRVRVSTIRESREKSRENLQPDRSDLAWGCGEAVVRQSHLVEAWEAEEPSLL